MTALIAIETVVIVLLTLLVTGLLRSHADILRRLHALDGGGSDAGNAVPATVGLAPSRAGRRAPDISGTGLSDDAVHLAVGGTSHRTLLAFLSSGCVTCRAFWDAFADPATLQLPHDVRLVVVAKDVHDESISELRSVATPELPVVLSTAAWHAYSVPGSPYFVLVDGASERVEGEGTGANWPQVRNLILQSGDDGSAREARIDAELQAYGIGPGDPALHGE
jgi:hypothetical protein